MKFSCLFFCLWIGGLFSSLTAQQPMIDSCNIVWHRPSAGAGESMPCGGGDIGLNVWVEKGDLLFYFARSSSFDENNALLKGGRIRIKLTPDPLLERAFRQELVLRDGNIVIRVPGAVITVWVDVYRPVIHVAVNGTRPLTAEVVYESWRTGDRVMEGKANNGNSYKWAYKHAPGGKVITYRDSIGFFEGGVLFYHRNRSSGTVFETTVHQQGLDSVKGLLADPLKGLCFGGWVRGSGMRPAGTVKGRYLDTDFTGWKLVSERPRRSQDIEVVLATRQVESVAEWKAGLQGTLQDVSAHGQTAQAVTRAWWKAFWERSFIYIGARGSRASRLDKEDVPQWQAGRNYQLFRYMLGCNAFGQFPTKFNGGLFTYDPVLTDSTLHFTPDFRNWGGGTMTAQNQRLVYWPMIKSGDFDLLRSQLEFYRRLLPTAELRTKVYWGHGGACFTEQLENFGLPNNAEYGWDKPAGQDKGVEYNAWLEYEWDTVLEFCLMMLETERYAGADIQEYLPFIGSCVTFFNEHYQYLALHRGRKALDGAGHLVLYPGSGAETYKMAYNSSSTIAGLRTILTRLLELPGSDDSLRQEWTTMLQRLPLLSFRAFDGHTTIAPALTWERLNNKESPQLYPVFPWGMYGVGKSGLDTAINTFKYDTDAVKFRSFIGWKQDNIFAARLGLTDEAAALTVEKLRDSKRRFPAFWGPGFDWTPDHNWGGSGMIGLQEMLLQTDGKKIFLYPAWPRDWDVHFKLHAPYATTVEGILRNGKVELLKVEPAERRKDVISAF